MLQIKEITNEQPQHSDLQPGTLMHLLGYLADGVDWRLVNRWLEPKWYLPAGSQHWLLAVDGANSQSTAAFTMRPAHH